MKLFWQKKTPEPTQEQQEEIEERKDMVDGVNELDVKTVKDVMVPRIDVAWVPLGITRGEFIDLIQSTSFSRYPVYDKTPDNIVGVLYAKDVLTAEDEPFSVKKLMRKAYFVPESKRLDDLLREFKRRKVHIAIAVDEFGGVSGIICMEDILEVIVGDIQDEFDNDEPEGVRKNESGWDVESRTSIEEVNETLGTDIKDTEHETIGGYVFELFGRVPQKGEKVSKDGWTFMVTASEGHMIKSLHITKG